MKHIESWDFFAPNHRSDVLRSGVLLASQIAENEQFRVRLFVDDLNALTSMNPRIDTSLWIQSHRYVTLAKLSLAGEIEPANNVVRLFGAKFPRKYIERATFGQCLDRKFFQIKLLDQSGPCTNKLKKSDTAPLQFIDVLQGDAPPAAGVIRDRRNLADLRSKWKTQRNLAQVTLQTLGFGHVQAADTLIICCWGAHIKNFRHFLTALGHASRRPVTFLVEPGQDTGQMQVLVDGWKDSSAGQHEGKVRVMALPPMSWSQRDEIVWTSDLVMTGDDDMAQRAIESGVPLMWLPHPREDGMAVSLLADWYLQPADLALTHRIQALTLAVSEGTPACEPLRRYIDQYEEIEHLANQIALRVARAPLLSRMLPELFSENSTSADSDRAYVHPYVATVPMTMPGYDEAR